MVERNVHEARAAEHLQVAQRLIAKILDVVRHRERYVAHVAGLVVEGPCLPARGEHGHAPAPRDVILPFVVGVPMHFAHRARLNVHRKEVFLPLKDAEYVRDQETGAVFLRALAVNDVDWKTFRKALPADFVPNSDGSPWMTSRASVTWATGNKPTEPELDALRGLNQLLRSRLQYINGTQTLWYLKTNSERMIARQSITLALAAMQAV
jgi:hypothetical protein